MLPRKNKLTSKEVRDVVAQRIHSRSDHLLVKRVQSPGEKKFTVVVSKKTKNQTAERNKLKRVLYGMIVKNMEKIKDGHYFILIKKVPEKIKEVEKEVTELLGLI